MSEETVTTTEPTGTQEPGQSQGDQTQQVDTSQTGAQTGKFVYNEDRSNWFPKARYDAVNQKYDQARAEAERYKAELEAERRRVAALAGVSPTDPQQAERERLRQELLEVYPELAALQEQEEDPQEAAARQAAQQAMNDRAAQKTLDLTWSRMAELTGGDLSDEEKQAAHHSLYRWVAADPTLVARWEAGDIDGVVDDFIKGQEFLINRGRRLGTQSTVGRNSQPRPSGRSGGMVRQSAPKLDFGKMKSIDEMLAAAEEESVARHKASGTVWGDDQL